MEAKRALITGIIGADGDAMRGVTVFAVAPLGIPYDTRWQTAPWAMEVQPCLLVDLLWPSDLPHFWRWSGLDSETRLHLSVRVFFRLLVHPALACPRAVARRDPARDGAGVQTGPHPHAGARR